MMQGGSTTLLLCYNSLDGILSTDPHCTGQRKLYGRLFSLQVYFGLHCNTGVFLEIKLLHFRMSVNHLTSYLVHLLNEAFLPSFRKQIVHHSKIISLLNLYHQALFERKIQDRIKISRSQS